MIDWDNHNLLEPGYDSSGEFEAAKVILLMQT